MKTSLEKGSIFSCWSLPTVPSILSMSKGINNSCWTSTPFLSSWSKGLFYILPCITVPLPLWQACIIKSLSFRTIQIKAFVTFLESLSTSVEWILRNENIQTKTKPQYHLLEFSTSVSRYGRYRPISRGEGGDRKGYQLNSLLWLSVSCLSTGGRMFLPIQGGMWSMTSVSWFFCIFCEL